MTITETYRQRPSGLTTLIWALFFFFVFAFIFVAGVRWAGASRGHDDSRATARTKAREDRLKDDREKLLSASWIDQPGGAVRVPIADAKRAILADLRVKKPAPSQIKVEPPLPMPTAPAGTSDPAPPALPSAPQGSDTLSFAAFAPPAAAVPDPPAQGGPAAPPSPGSVVPSPAPAPSSAAPPASLPVPPGSPSLQKEAPSRPPLIDGAANPNPSSN